jgi:hypothetical protein
VESEGYPEQHLERYKKINKKKLKKLAKNAWQVFSFVV